MKFDLIIRFEILMIQVISDILFGEACTLFLDEDNIPLFILTFIDIMYQQTYKESKFFSKKIQENYNQLKEINRIIILSGGDDFIYLFMPLNVSNLDLIIIIETTSVCTYFKL